MAKKKKETLPAAKEVFNLSNPTQEDIPGMLSKVEEQISAISGNLPKESSTNKEFPGFGKVSEITKASDLIKMHSVLNAKELNYNSSKETLQKVVDPIKLPAFSLNGHSAKQWRTDIEARIVIVAHKNKLDKLNKVKSTLESHLSEEMRLKKDLLAISSEITETIE